MTILRFLIDTDILVYLRQRRSSAIAERFAKLSFGEAAMSVVTYGELAFGVEKGRTRSRSLAMLQELAATIPVLPLLPEAGAIYGQLRANLEIRGEIIGAND